MLLNSLQELEIKNKEMKNQLQKYKDRDPAILKAKKEANEISLTAANRWTGIFHP